MQTNTTDVTKGDNTAAFGGIFLTIQIQNPDLYKISKIIFSTNGTILKTFKDDNFFQQPETTLTVNYTSEETQLFKAVNIGKLIAYDENGYQYTCTQYVSFTANNGAICPCKI